MDESRNRIVRTLCNHCLNSCGMRVEVRNDVPVKIEGDYGNPHNHGLLCAKGLTALQSLQTPNRIKKPLLRTNAKKGIGEDPGFKEVRWEEALELVAERLRALRKRDPRRLIFVSFDTWSLPDYAAFTSGFGSPNITPWSADFFCGNNVHSMTYLMHGSMHTHPDLRYSKYILLFGTQFGFGVNYDVTHSASLMAEARRRGAKLVVVDPICTPAAGKADLWVPIRPGTDAMLILGMINLLLNKFNLYDNDFLRRYTNGPYIVGEDGRYIRDNATNKPLVYDSILSEFKPFNQVQPNSMSLEGKFTYNGHEVKTAFTTLKEHVKKYDPKTVSDVTTVPTELILQVSKEFGEAASIGKTITIDGVEIPYRPAALTWYRGFSAHKHSFLAGFAIQTLPTLVGAIDVPGGCMGVPYSPQTIDETEDGLLACSRSLGQAPIRVPYPPRTVTRPQSSMLIELFPVAPYSPVMIPLSYARPEVYKPPYDLEMMFQVRANLLKTSAPMDIIERFLQKIPFIVSFAREPEETTQFADVVFPDLHFLERQVEMCVTNYMNPGLEPRYYMTVLPAVKPPFEPPYDKLVSILEILFELAERADFLGDIYEMINVIFQLTGEQRLGRDRKYTFEQIQDRRLKSKLGVDRGLDWFKQNSVLTLPKPIEDAYPRPFIKPRIPIYFEFMLESGKQVENLTKELGIPWDTSDYQALPDWKPCPSYSERTKGYDLYAVNYKLPTHSLSFTRTIPSLNKISGRKMDLILIHPKTAANKGINEGDEIRLENSKGRSVQGTAHVTEGIHPEVLGIAGCGGGSVNGKRRPGIDFNNLLHLDEDHIDFVSAALDACISVKVSQADSTNGGQSRDD